MSTLPAPPVVGERATSTHDCGPACVASILQWAGRTDTEIDVADWLTARGEDSGGTSAKALADYISSHGIGEAWDEGNVPMSTYVPQALARGHLVIGLHQCDGGARPVPRGSTKIAHWRVFYANDIGVYRTMNPWPPDLETLYQVTFAAADLRSHVEVMLPVAPSTTHQEFPMFTIFTAKTAAGGLADFLSVDLQTYRWIQTPAQLTDIQNLAAAAGQTIVMHAIGLPVADLGAFGLPADPLTASMVNQAFPGASGGGALTPDQALAIEQIPGLVTAITAIAAKLNKDLA